MLPCIHECCNPRRRGDWAAWTALGRRIHTARKAHTCTRCGAPIEPGEIYKVESGLLDGQFTSYKTHRRWCE